MNRNRPYTLWRIMVSWALVIMMIVTLGGVQAMHYDDIAEFYDGENLVINNDDPIDDGSNNYIPSDPNYPDYPAYPSYPTYPDDPDDQDDPDDNIAQDPPHGDNGDTKGDNDGDDYYDNNDYPYNDYHDYYDPYFDEEELLYINFLFAENPVIIEDIFEIFSPTAFMLYGVAAIDETGENIEVTILCHGDSLLYDGSFDMERLFEEDYFTVTYAAVHPETDEIFTASRNFYTAMPIVMLSDGIEITGAGAHIIGAGELGVVTGIVTGTITVQNGGTLIMHDGSIQGPNLAVPPVRVIVQNGGSFYMTGGEIRGHAANTGTFGVQVNAGGRFIMGACSNECLACNYPYHMSLLAVDETTPPYYYDLSSANVITPPIIIGHNADTRPAVMVAGGTFDMHDGSIRLTTNINARGVRVDRGTFNMHGGEICNITPHPANLLHDAGNTHGIGVDMRGGVFNMHYPASIHSTATAVNLTTTGAPVFNMHGGEIFDNRTGSTNRSPGVNILNGTFHMSGGTIRNNFQTWAANVDDGGAGVRLMNNTSRFNMTGGTISDNTHLGGIGGGVHVRSGAIFEMSGNATITRNTAGRVDTGAGGGGVAVRDAHFVMHSGTISQNRTRTSGGGVAVHGSLNRQSATFIMHSGTITDNEATNNRTGVGIGGAGYYSGGGGVWVYRATFTMHNGNITHNRTGGFWNSWRGAAASPSPASTTFRASVPHYSERTSSAAWMAEAATFDSRGTGGQNQNGGGVLALRDSHFTMNNGTISHNVAGDFLDFWGGNWNSLPRGGTYHGGGGIATRNHAIVNIAGGNITHNRSPAGGGIYVDNWSQVTVSNTRITHNVAYGRLFTNLLGWDGRGGGGIAMGDGLYYGDRHFAHPIPTSGSGTPPFDVINPASRHHNTAICILDGTVITHNISGGDGGGIYWWASSAVRMDDERYLHGLRVLPGAIVENNLAYAGLPYGFNSLVSGDSRLTSVWGRIDDDLNNRHNLTPRRRVATSVVRNGRVNPGGMWIDQRMAYFSRITPAPGHHFAGPGHHAFNNHDIRTVGGSSWLRPTRPQMPDDLPPTMQEISQGRVQLEIVGPNGGPVQGSDTAFPHVDMGNLQVAVNFGQAPALPNQLPTGTGTEAQRTAFATLRQQDRVALLAPPSNINITQNSPNRSAAVHVYSVLPARLDTSDNPVNADGNPINARTHHGTNVTLNISTQNGAAPTHRVTNIEVFGACGCRVLDGSWINVLRPQGWSVGSPIPNNWAPGPYLLNHICLTHSNGANFSGENASPRAGGTVPSNLRGTTETIREQTFTLPSYGDRFYHEGCLACRDEHPTIAANANPILHSTYHTFTHTHILDFLTVGRPYTHRPGGGFGAYGLVFRVTVEPIEENVLRLGIIGDSIDFGTHDILEVLRTQGQMVRLDHERFKDLIDNEGNPVEDSEGNTVRVLNGTDPREIGLTVHDSRLDTERTNGWHVTVQADGDGIFNNMLRLNNGQNNNQLGAHIGDAAAVLLTNHHADERNLSICDTTHTSGCTCTTRLTRVTWQDLIDMHRDIVVCMNVNTSRIPPAELHRAVLTWTVIGETPTQYSSWTFEENSADMSNASNPPSIITVQAYDAQIITSISDTPRRSRVFRPSRRIES